MNDRRIIAMTNLQNVSINPKSTGNAVTIAQAGSQAAISHLGAPFADTTDPFAVMLARQTEKTDPSSANGAPGAIAVDVAAQTGMATMPQLMANIAMPVLRQPNGYFPSPYHDETTIHSTRLSKNDNQVSGYKPEIGSQACTELRRRVAGSLPEGRHHTIPHLKEGAIVLPPSGLPVRGTQTGVGMDGWLWARAHGEIFTLTGQEQAAPSGDPALAAMLLQLHQERRSSIASDATSATVTVSDTHGCKTVSLTDEKQGSINTTPGRNNAAPAAIVRQNAADIITAKDADAVKYAELPARTPTSNSAPAVFPYMTPYIPASNHAGIGLTIATTLGNYGWAEDFSQRITWISTQKNQFAELHLNPPDLGQLNVVLKISDNQATAIFTSPHSAVREAVENALPALREILADNGIMLGNATVNDQPPNTAEGFMNQGSDTAGRRKFFSSTSESNKPSLPVALGVAIRRHTGMVDTYA